MPGPVKQFVDFTNNTNADTGENNAGSIQPIVNGENVDQTVLQRPSESLRQRTEAVRNIETDSLYLRDADRSLILAGPGKITWPGSTTALATGVPSISDNLYLLPMLTPGFAQAAPIPPVASAFGKLHLKRASDSMNSIAVTSLRRSYAAGDQINVTVSSGLVFSCVLDVETVYQRTIRIVATGTTTLAVVIAALAALTPTGPIGDTTPIVTAALEGGALGTDLLLTTQARQYLTGNYDGEGHTITPANLASFFVSNPLQALGEGDSLCINFPMVSDTASTGGRRQALPENSNTAIPAGAFFNSRSHPENLVNALPICKVVNNRLVFATGCEIPSGAVAADLAFPAAATMTYGGGPNWADGTTNPATTVENQLDKIVSDLAGATGTGKIQGSAVGGGSELVAATLSAQLIALVAKALGWTTIGNGTTVIGDFNTNTFANANALLTAAIAALPTEGGRIVIKKGVALAGFASATIALPAGKTVEIIGGHNSAPSTPQITFAASEGLVCSATGKLVLRNLSVQTDGAEVAVALTTSPCEVYDCRFQNTGALMTSDANPFFKGTNVSDLTMERVEFTTTAIPASANGNNVVLIITGTANRVFLRKIRYSNPTGDAMSGISIVDVRNDVLIEDYSYDCTVIDAFGAAGLTLASSDNVTNIRNRNVVRYTARGEYSLIFGNSAPGFLTIKDMDDRSQAGQSCSAGGTAFVRYIDCKLQAFGNYTGGFSDLRFENCDFYNGLTTIGTSTDTHGTIVFDRCRFTYRFEPLIIQGKKATLIRVANCTFSGQYDTSLSVPALTVEVGTGALAAQFCQRIEIEGNTFSDFYNVAWAGSNVSFNLVLVKTDGCGQLVVRNNRASNLLRSSSGTARHGAYLLNIDKHSTGAQVFDLVVTDNIVGAENESATLDYCGLLNIINMSVMERTTIKRNTVYAEYDPSSAAIPRIDYIVKLFGSGATQVNRYGLLIENNDFFVDGLSGTIANFGIVSWIHNLAGGTMDVITFNHNNVISNGAIAIFDGSTGFGANFAFTGGGSLGHMSVLGNVATVDSFEVANWFTIRVAGAPGDGTIPSAFPAVSAAFANNINVARV